MIVFWNSILMAKIMRRKNLKNKILVEKYKRYHFIQTPLSCWFIFKIQKDTYLGPPQVKCRFLISSIFYAMNFQHFLEMLEFNLWHF